MKQEELIESMLEMVPLFVSLAAISKSLQDIDPSVFYRFDKSKYDNFMFNARM